MLAGQIVEHTQRGFGKDGPCGIAGAVDHDGSRARSHETRERSNFWLISRAERVEYGPAAEEQHLLDVVGPVDLGHQHFLARAEHDIQSCKERLGGAGSDDDLIGRGGEPVPRPRLLGEGCAQLLDAGGGRVVRLAGAERRRSRLDHGSGRSEVGIADVQAEYGSAPRALHLVGEAEHGTDGGERNELATE